MCSAENNFVLKLTLLLSYSAYKLKAMYLHAANKCDCLSENSPSSHLPVFRENAILKIQLKNQPCLGSEVIPWT